MYIFKIRKTINKKEKKKKEKKYNLQAKIVSFLDQEKLYNEVVFSIAFSMNAITKDSQIKHCPCPKSVVI